MKKILSALALMLFVSSATIAQSNLTWVMKEKADNAYFNRTEFNYTISGFSNAKEAAAFYTKMKENADVTSVQDKGKDATGNYQVLVAMKSAQNKAYYLNWATKLGVAYIVTVKGEKKTPQEMLTAAKEVRHTEETHTH
jgi:hypothetical protein